MLLCTNLNLNRVEINLRLSETFELIFTADLVKDIYFNNRGRNAARNFSVNHFTELKRTKSPTCNGDVMCFRNQFEVGRVAGYLAAIRSSAVISLKSRQPYFAASLTATGLVRQHVNAGYWERLDVRLLIRHVPVNKQTKR